MCNRHMRCGWFFWGTPFVLIFIALGSLVVMLLWNSLFPEIFGFKPIDYLQAAGLLVLSKILFGGFGRKSRHFYGHHNHFRKRADGDVSVHSDEEAKS
jgi:hypothetical protein